MIKKLTHTLLITTLILTTLLTVKADDENEEPSQEDLVEVINNVADEPVLSSRIAVAYDRNSGKVIWGKDENRRSAMASTTKIMTAILLIENSELDKTVTISAKSAGTGGSRLGLKKNDTISMKDLLYGLMLKSGNDAAVAIAETVGR